MLIFKISSSAVEYTKLCFYLYFSTSILFWIGFTTIKKPTMRKGKIASKWTGTSADGTQLAPPAPGQPYGYGIIIEDDNGVMLFPPIVVAITDPTKMDGKKDVRETMGQTGRGLWADDFVFTYHSITNPTTNQVEYILDTYDIAYVNPLEIAGNIVLDALNFGNHIRYVLRAIRPDRRRKIAKAATANV
jgi:hypothetical protein